MEGTVQTTMTVVQEGTPLSGRGMSKRVAGDSVSEVPYHASPYASKKAPYFDSDGDGVSSEGLSIGEARSDLCFSRPLS